MNKFNDIKTRNDLADFLDVPRQKLTYVLYVKKIDNLYVSFEIPKKNGDPRQIYAPMNDLKSIQKKIANALWKHQVEITREKCIKTNISHGFEKKKSIITNAKIHRNKRYVLNLDLKDFFESFHFGRVKGFFEKNNNFTVPNEVATVIAQLVCYKNHLPQGAPSSPIITNLISNILDFRLLKISKKYKLDYTRYADDLTFSTNNKSFLDKKLKIYDEIANEIERAGFKINDAKTRLQFRDSKQVVTGLIVNKKINVDRNYCKKTRAMAHSLYLNGSFEIDGELGNINQLEGRLSFINQLDWYNNELDDTIHKFHNLNSREKEYQRFLYYKYFFANCKPLIVTEGKTDIAYLKSALKNLYNEYPDLIVKKNDREFEFKVSFLRRTKRLRYFLNIVLDGADTMKNICNFYLTRNNVTNYQEYFIKLGKVKPTNPVILIVDNENTNSQDKPLKKIIKYIGIDEKAKENFKKNLQIKINGNLYLITNQLVKGKFECEIEDLFDQKVLEHEINGKSFSREKIIDRNLYYEKEEFSKYIEKDFKKIDFTNFKPILNNINQIINTYKK